MGDEKKQTIHLCFSLFQQSKESTFPTPLTLAELDATAMLLATSLTCLDLEAVMVGTTTVMPTLLEDSGALSMTPLRLTSTPLLVPSIPAAAALETGGNVIVEVARTMLSMLTPT